MSTTSLISIKRVELWPGQQPLRTRRKEVAGHPRGPDNAMPRRPVSYQYFSARPQLARGPVAFWL